MSSNNVEKIKERLGIVDVVSQYVKLEKAGSNFKARCPFHNEKTPSFFVSPSRNSFYCFGCNAKGDIFSFVEQFESLDFIGALKVLGERAGVQIVFEKNSDKDERAVLFDIMEKATIFFEKNLENHKEVNEYLRLRGIDKSTAKEWRIGYANDSWSNLYDYLEKKYSAQDIEKAGLIKKSEKKDGYYDRFRGRIMFPIFDGSGRVIAFSGRIFKDDDKSAKYINSPETALFSKSKVLYGYDKAKFSIRKNNFSIIVEGQVDVILSHKNKFANTVALSGTALTFEQIHLIKRLSDNVIFAFDSDPAGIVSSGKSAIATLSVGMDVKVAHLKQGEDPADVLNSSGGAGKKRWTNIIKESKHIVEFSLDILLETISDKRKLLLKASQTVLPYIARISNKIDQEHFISVFASKIGVSEDAVREELKKTSLDPVVYDNKPVFVLNKTATTDKKSSIEKKLSGILLLQKNLNKSYIDVNNVIKEFERICGKEKALHITQNEDIMEELLFEAEKFHIDNSAMLKEEVTELLINLEKEYLREGMDIILTELRLLEANKGEDRKIDKLTKKYKKLSDLLLNLQIKKI